MKFLLLNTDYPLFLEQMYREQPGLSSAPYGEQMAARNATFFGVGDAYARALRARGHEANDIHMNNAFMQRAWVAEHGPRDVAVRYHLPGMRLRRGVVPWIDRSPRMSWYLDVLAAQVEHHRPDVVLNHDPAWVPAETLRSIVGDRTLLIGQHAATKLGGDSYAAYDLFVSSWPPTVEALREQSLRAEHLALGFDPLVLDALERAEPRIRVSFVGSFSNVHQGRLEFVETLCRSLPDVQVFSPSISHLDRGSAIRTCYQGPAFGLRMYEVLASSEVTLNHHGLDEPHANNMRLFEGTGVGTVLLTDDKPDLTQYFTPGREVLTYRTAEDCVETIQQLSGEDRASIAAAGQHRTLEDHNWVKRIGALLAFLD